MLPVPVVPDLRQHCLASSYCIQAHSTTGQPDAACLPPPRDRDLLRRHDTRTASIIQKYEPPRAFRTASRTANGAEMTTTEPKAQRVLVVDDSETIRRSAEIFLKQSGFEVIMATDGFDALAKICDHNPDLILVDIKIGRAHV